MDTPYISSEGFPCLRTNTEQSYSKKGGMSTYINKSLNFKLNPKISINNRDVESFLIKAFFEKKRSTLIHIFYRPKGVETFL